MYQLIPATSPQAETLTDALSSTHGIYKPPRFHRKSQVDIVLDLIQKLEREGIKSIEAQHDYEVKWKDAI
jgi:hypothetical protein